MKFDELKDLVNLIINGLEKNPEDLDLLYKFLFIIENNIEIMNSQDEEINKFLANSIKILINNYDKVDFSNNKCYNNNIQEQNNDIDIFNFLKRNFSENLSLSWLKKL